MQKLNKKQIESKYPSLTIEKKDINSFIVVNGDAHTPVRFWSFSIYKTFKGAEISAKWNMGENIRPIIQVIKQEVIKMQYINIKNGGAVESVDEFETYKEAKEMVKEYNLSDSYNHYYISQRCTNDWKNK